MSPFEVRREYFQVSEYFNQEVEVRPGMTVLDVGANLGLFSLELLQRCGGDARLFAFEPAPASFAVLERNVRELFPDSRVSLQCCALADQPGATTLYYRPRLSTLSSLHREPQVNGKTAIDAMFREDPGSGFQHRLPPPLRRLARPAMAKILECYSWWLTGKVVEVPCEVKTVSQIIHEAGIDRIDLLKIDVEGAELAVLDGIEPHDWPRVRAISAEVHNIDGRVDKMRSLLNSVGFERIRFNQEWPFEGTTMHMLEAARADDTPPAGSRSTAHLTGPD